MVRDVFHGLEIEAKFIKGSTSERPLDTAEFEIGSLTGLNKNHYIETRMLSSNTLSSNLKKQGISCLHAII